MESINPYAASTTSDFESAAVPPSLVDEAGAVHYDFHYATTGLSKVLRGLLFVYLLISLLWFFSKWMQLNLLSQPKFEPTAADMNDLRQAVVGFASMGVSLTTMVVFSFWINRSHHNVRWFGAGGLTVTPGWAVGYFFIPFINLYKPYKAMAELYRASRAPLTWTRRDSSGITPLWWAIYLFAGILGNVVMRSTMNAQSIDELKVASGANMFVGLVDLPLCLMAMTLVGAIQASQQAWVDSEPEKVGAAKMSSKWSDKLEVKIHPS